MFHVLCVFLITYGVLNSVLFLNTVSIVTCFLLNWFPGVFLSMCLYSVVFIPCCLVFSIQIVYFTVTGCVLLYRLFVVFKHRPEEFFVSVNVYDSEGKLIESREYSGVKQVVFNKCTVVVSKHLKLDPLVIVAEVEKPRVDYRESGLLYISSEV